MKIILVAACALALLAVDADATAAPAHSSKPKLQVATTDYELEVLCPRAADLIHAFERNVKSAGDWRFLRDMRRAFVRACPGVPL